MILSFAILIPIYVAVIWYFIKYSPEHGEPGKLRLYNRTSFLLSVLISGGYIWRLYVEMSKGSDFGWWPIVALIFFLLISIVVLSVAGLLRNFLFFHKRGA